MVLLVVLGVLAAPAESASDFSFDSSDAVVTAPATVTVFVHVVGEVIRPGIYELAAGSRVADAVAAAGGITETALDSSVNLARVLSDGEQIFVRSQFTTEADDPIVSLNRASAKSLESLPGVGPALAARIVEWRDRNGSFSAIEQLLEVSGIGAKLFENLKDLVTL